MTAWLGTEGVEIENVSADNTSIYASAPVAKIEDSLQVQMVRVSRDGFTYTAARNAPSLPVSVGAAVQAIGGLQPFRQAHKHSRRRRGRNSNRSALGVAGPGAPVPAPSISNSPPYLPSEILKAYNADGLGLDGGGQTIAILIDTFPADADMQACWQQANLPATLAQCRKGACSARGKPAAPRGGRSPYRSSARRRAAEARTLGSSPLRLSAAGRNACAKRAILPARPLLKPSKFAVKVKGRLYSQANRERSG